MTPTETPDWIAVLTVLRRRPFQSDPTPLLDFLAASGFVSREDRTYRLTPDGQDRLESFERINGTVEHRSADRPMPGLASAMSWARYAATGKYIADDERLRREAICDACEYVRTDSGGNWCSICGCGVSANDRKITNLTAYEEIPGHPLCKHPQRSAGKGWPLPQIPNPGNA